MHPVRTAAWCLGWRAAAAACAGAACSGRLRQWHLCVATHMLPGCLVRCHARPPHRRPAAHTRPTPLLPLLCRRGPPHWLQEDAGQHVPGGVRGHRGGAQGEGAGWRCRVGCAGVRPGQETCGGQDGWGRRPSCSTWCPATWCPTHLPAHPLARSVTPHPAGAQEPERVRAGGRGAARQAAPAGQHPPHRRAVQQGAGGRRRGWGLWTAAAGAAAPSCQLMPCTWIRCSEPPGWHASAPASPAHAPPTRPPPPVQVNDRIMLLILADLLGAHDNDPPEDSLEVCARV